MKEEEIKGILSAKLVRCSRGKLKKPVVVQVEECHVEEWKFEMGTPADVFLAGN